MCMIFVLVESVMFLVYFWCLTRAFNLIELILSLTFNADFQINFVVAFELIFSLIFKLILLFYRVFIIRFSTS